MRAGGIGIIARGIGYAAVAAVIVAAAAHFRQHDLKPRDPSGIAVAPSTDRLARELARCEQLGLPAKDDAACAAAWAENRRRFFTYAPAPDAPAASAQPGQPQ